MKLSRGQVWAQPLHMPQFFKNKFIPSHTIVSVLKWFCDMAHHIILRADHSDKAGYLRWDCDKVGYSWWTSFKIKTEEEQQQQQNQWDF